MALPVPKEAILAEIQRLQAQGLGRDEIVKSLITNIKGFRDRAKTPREAGGTELVVPPTPSDALSAIPGVAGTPTPAEAPGVTVPQSGQFEPWRGEPSMSPRPLRFDEKMAGWKASAAEFILAQSGVQFDPNGEPGPELLKSFLVVPSLALQLAGGAAGFEGGKLAVESAKALPWVGRLMGWLGPHVGAAVGAALPYGATAGATTGDANVAVKETGEMAAGIVAIDAALTGLGKGAIFAGRVTGLTPAAQAAWGVVREKASIAINHAMHWTDEWVRSLTKPLTSDEREAIGRFVGRQAAEAIRDSSSPAMVLDAQRYFSEVLKQARAEAGDTAPVLDGMVDEMKATFRGEGASKQALALKDAMDKLQRRQALVDAAKDTGIAARPRKAGGHGTASMEILTTDEEAAAWRAAQAAKKALEIEPTPQEVAAEVNRRVQENRRAGPGRRILDEDPSNVVHDVREEAATKWRARAAPLAKAAGMTDDEYAKLTLPQIKAIATSPDAVGVANSIAQEIRTGTKRWAEERRAAPSPNFPLRIQRIEERGIAPGSADKPHGLYTSPTDVTSPHADLGGTRTLYNVSPSSKVMTVKSLERDPDLVFRQGAISSGAGVAAARDLLGLEEFRRLRALSREALIQEFRGRYPDVQWNRYLDRQELFEAIGGIEARRAGYDAIYDPSLTAPEFSEFVVLNSKIIHQTSNKEGRLAALHASKERVAAVKAAAPLEGTTVADLAAAQKADDGWRLLSGDEALDEVTADPLGKRGFKLALPEASTGGGPPATALSQVKEQASGLGLSVSVVEAQTKAAGSTHLKGQPDTLFLIRNQDGTEVFRAKSLTDAAAEIQRLASGNRALAVALEPLNEIALAQDDDDDPDTATMKTVLRNTVRGATMGMLLPPSTRRSFVTKLDGRMTSFLGQLVDDGTRARAAQRWADAKNSIASLYFSLRSPEELFRREPTFAGATSSLASAKRALDFEANTIRQLLDVTARRAGLKASSSEAAAAGKLVDAIDRDLLVKLPTSGPGVADAWRKALDRSSHLTTPERTSAAREALGNLSPHQLQVTQRLVKDVFHGLRRRATDTYIRTFEREEGRLRPFAVLSAVVKDKEGKPLGTLLKDGGEFVDRFASQGQADNYIKVKAKKLRASLPADASLVMADGRELPVSKATDFQLTGLRTVASPSPLPVEIEARMGKTLSAYLPHLFYEEGKAGFDMSEMLEAFPQLHPARLVEELDRLAQVSNTRPYVHNGVEYKTTRSAFEAVFGQMDDDEFKPLLKAALTARAVGHAAADEMIFSRVPRRMYVRFYKDRLDKVGYDTDIVKATSAYAGAVLRDIHYTPVLGDVKRALESGVASKDVHPGLVREFKGWVDDTLRLQPSYDAGLARATGWLTSLAYNGILLGRPGPAFKNIVGQTFLVGLPEMGFDSAAGALALVFNRDMNMVLADVPFIAHALPLGETGVVEAWKRLSKESFTSLEKLAAGKDVVKAAFNVMAASEYAIRKWAFMGGILEQAKKEGLVSPNRVIDWLRPGARDELKSLGAKWKGIPDAQAGRLIRSGEDMVRRTAFFFESSNMPRAYRTLRRLPGGPALLQFTNFPINYANRLATIARDAFDRSLPAAERRANQGKILRHLGMTFLIAGPLGLPIVNELVKSTSALDEGVGERLRHYQAYWAQWTLDRDTSGFSTFAPVTDLLTPNRFATAPIPRLAVHAAEAIGERPLEELFGMHPVLAQEVRDGRQKALGALSPYVGTGVAPPDNQFLPEALATLAPAGYLFEDFWKASKAYERQGSNGGPLDRRGFLSGPVDPSPLKILGIPVTRLFTGTESEVEARARRDDRYAAKQAEADRLLKADFMRALTDPELPERLKRRTFRQVSAKPDLLSSLDEDDVASVMTSKSALPIERKIALMPPLEALKLQMKVNSDLREVEHMSPSQRTYLARVLRAIVLRSAQ